MRFENRFCAYPLLILLSVVIASFVIAQTNEIVIENARISAKLSTGFAESSSYSYSTGYELWMGTGHDIAARYGVGYYLEIYRNVSGSLESIYSQSCTGYGYASEIVSAPRVPIHKPSLVASPSSVPIPIPGVGTASRASAVYGIGYGLEIVDNASGSMLYGSTPTGSGLARSVSVVLGAVGKGSNTTLGYGAWLSTSYVATVQSVAYYALSIEKNGVVVHSLSYSPSYGYGLGLDLDVKKVVVRSYEPRPPGSGSGGNGNGGGGGSGSESEDWSTVTITTTSTVVFPIPNVPPLLNIGFPQLSNATVGGLLSLGFVVAMVVGAIVLESSIPRALALAGGPLVVMGVLFGNAGMISVGVGALLFALVLIHRS